MRRFARIAAVASLVLLATLAWRTPVATRVAPKPVVREQSPSAPAPAAAAARSAARAIPAPVTAASTGFSARSGRVTAFFTDLGMALSLPGPGKKAWGLHWGLAGGIHQAPKPQGELPARINRFVGAPSTWVTDQPSYSGVVYENVRPGIDLVLESRPQGVEYSFRAAPGADVRSLRMTYAGALDLRASEDGSSLEIVTGHGVIRESDIYCYQDAPEGRRTIPARYRVTGPGEYTLELDPIDERLALVIDPTIKWSTYLGGADQTGNSGIDDLWGVAVGPNGAVYVAGLATTSDFPVPGGFDTTLGLTDAVISKINPTNSTLVWSTYLGGSYYDFGRALTVDCHGSVYVAGETMSTDFPVVGGFGSTLGGSRDGFVAKIASNGSSILWSSYLGGTGEDFPRGVEVDAVGNVYVVGETTSSDFPTVHAIDSTLGGGYDGFVTKINPTGSAIVWSSYIGGSATDGVSSVAVDGSGNVYLTGGTQSSDFPVFAGLQMTMNGYQDAYVMKLRGNLAAPTIVWSTYLGGSDYETATSVALDLYRNVYVGGQTASGDFPILNAFTGSFGGGSYDGFLAKIHSSGTALVWSTYVGGSGPDDVTDVAVDLLGRVYVTGNTASADLPVVNAVDATLGDGVVPMYDAFVSVFNPSGTSLLFCTYLGGSDNETVHGLAVDLGTGRLYVTGQTFSADFPTSGGFDTTFGGASDGFVTRIDLGRH